VKTRRTKYQALNVQRAGAHLVVPLRQVPLRQPVIPVRWTDQTGHKRITGRDSIGAGAPWVALESADHLEHPQSP
jgi:hypothetical protein